jgi:hypothetical protein
MTRGESFFGTIVDRLQVVRQIETFKSRNNKIKNRRTPMTINKKIKSIAFGAALIGAYCFPASANALVTGTSQSGTTNVSVITPAFVVLSYYDTINLTLSAPTSGDGKISSAQGINVSWNGGQDTETVDAAISGTGGTGVTSVTLQNAWAVRGLSPSGNVTVAIASASGDTLSNGTSTIGMSGYTVSSGAIAAAASITAPLAGLSSAKSTKGNVNLTLDFSGTTKAGSHTGGKFQITATTI